MPNRPYSHDQLQERLTQFAISVCKRLLTERRNPVSDYYTAQLIRSSTSPGANYSEARDAESRRDFIHKMKICLKELRETDYWLRFKSGVTTRDSNDDALLKECDELIAIFVSSIKTARQ
jgi:four helix bundle protein